MHSYVPEFRFLLLHLQGFSIKSNIHSYVLELDFRTNKDHI